MLERGKILQAWKLRSRNYADTHRKRLAQSFFDYMRNNPGACYDDLEQEFRRNYYEAIDEILPAVLDIDDPLVTYHVIKRADLNNAKEASAVQNLIQQVDGVKHQVTLRELARSGTDDVRATLRAKPDLPPKVILALNPQRVTRSAATAEKTTSPTATKSRKPRKSASADAPEG